MALLLPQARTILKYALFYHENREFTENSEHSHSVTGESYPVYLFIAVLPCSGYTYAEATSDMKLENWLNCHIHAYEYFGGATRLLIPDNLKTGVIKNTRYETVLNRSCQELAEYYDTAILFLNAGTMYSLTGRS